MLYDYLRSCWRGVLHNKVATFINIGGLALGLTVFFALIFYVHREFSWDAHWEDADRLYRAAGSQESPTGNTAALFTNAPYALGTSLQTRNPGAFEVFARVYQSQATVTIDAEDYPNQGMFLAEPGLLELIQLETLEGSLQEVFADPRSIAVGSRMADRFFAGKPPLGKTITFSPPQGGKRDYVVRAVYRVPEPSSLAHMQFLGLLDITALPVQNAGLDIWNQPQPPQPPQIPFNVTHYFKLNEAGNKAQLEADLRAFMDQNDYMTFGENKIRFTFQNLQDVHLMPGPFDPADNVQRLWVYAGVGILVLLISGCNFVMLATLRSVDRLREVGIRKTVGGSAGQLMQQYLLDAFCQSLVAAALAVALLELVLPRFQVMLELPLEPDLLGWRSLGLCLAIVTGFTLLSSALPAWLMSRGQPASLLRDSSGSVVASGNVLRRLLVGFQFAIVIVLLLASAVVQQQIEYTQGRDRGFSLENLMAVRLNNFELMQKSPTLVAEFNRIPGVQSAAVGGVSPSSIMISQPNQVRRVMPDGSVREAPVQQTAVGGDYFRTLSVAVLAGREFTVELEGTAPIAQGAPPPTLRDILLNQSAAQQLGFDIPEMAVGQLLETEFSNSEGRHVQSLRVIGVVADTQFSSVMLPPVPQYYGFSPQNGFLAIKFTPGADIAAVTESLETAWTGVMGDVAFSPLAPELLDGNMLRREEFEARILIVSTVLAMVIALMGLYGLVGATVVRRVKEIGVRKVMGAGRTSIITLLLWQFSKPVVVANLIAWPFGFWSVMQWLQRFPYQLDMQKIVASGLAASAAALLIAWLTVGFMAAKAASTKPAQVLRSE